MDLPNQPIQTINPLLSRVKLPGETFTLPSGGLFYKDGVLDSTVKNAEVYVQPMTAIDEIVMKTPDLLFSGKAAEQVFRRCIPQVLDIYSLLSNDVDYLLACLRKVSYGDTMQVEYKHNCENATMHTYNVDISNFLQRTKRIDPTTVSEKYTVSLPNGQNVKMKPVTFGQFIHMMQVLNTSTADESPEEIRDELVKSMADLIVSVDDIDDVTMISEWLMTIPAGYIEAMKVAMDDNSGWGIDFSSNTECKDCSTQIEISASVNPLAFFT